MIDRQYSSRSVADKGTLFQLKQLVNRTSFVKDSKHNMKACEDFLEVVLYGHTIAAAKEVTLTSEECMVNDIAGKIISNFVKITTPNIRDNDSSLEDDSLEGTATEDAEQDSVYTYAVDLLTIGLLWYGFRDAVREGDGDRIVRYWKFLMVIFKTENHYNYANEGFNFLAQTTLLSPRKVSELKWSRTVNTSGRKGKNIPVDLHMEHLNRRLKIMLRHLGSNIMPLTAERTARVLGVVQKVCAQFKAESGITRSKDFHSVPSVKKDLSHISKQLIDSEVFKVLDNRRHNGYLNYKPLFESVNWKKITGWVKEKVSNYT